MVDKNQKEQDIEEISAAVGHKKADHGPAHGPGMGKGEAAVAEKGNGTPTT